MDEIYEFVDQFGETHRCGTIPKDPDIPVGAAFEEQPGYVEWTDEEINSVLTAPGRTSRIQAMKDTGFLDDFTKKANQFRTSACNGWLDANAYTLARFFGGNQDRSVFSGAYNYSLMNGGRDAGSSLVDGFRTSTANGFVTVEACPWDKIYRRDTRQFDSIAAQNKAVDPFPARTKRGFLTGMAQGFIGGVAIQVGPETERVGRYGVAGVNDGPGNHAVVAIQMNLLPNGQYGFPTYLNWGPKHGNGGFITTTWDHFASTFPRHLFWLMPIGQWGG